MKNMDILVANTEHVTGTNQAMPGKPADILVQKWKISVQDRMSYFPPR
jgi:hypothetical protein